MNVSLFEIKVFADKVFLGLSWPNPMAGILIRDRKDIRKGR